MPEITITSLMKQHHAVIDALLSNLRQAIEDKSVDVDKIFDQYDTQLKQHVSIEESEIFNFSKKIDPKAAEIIFTLMKEHQTMRTLDDQIFQNLTTENKSAISELVELLAKHISVEENILYPGLDETLPEDKKEYMIKRIQEVSGALLSGLV